MPTSVGEAMFFCTEVVSQNRCLPDISPFSQTCFAKSLPIFASRLDPNLFLTFIKVA